MIEKKIDRLNGTCQINAQRNVWALYDHSYISNGPIFRLSPSRKQGPWERMYVEEIKKLKGLGAWTAPK